MVGLLLGSQGMVCFWQGDFGCTAGGLWLHRTGALVAWQGGLRLHCSRVLVATQGGLWLHHKGGFGCTAKEGFHSRCAGNTACASSRHFHLPQCAQHCVHLGGMQQAGTRHGGMQKAATRHVIAVLAGPFAFICRYRNMPSATLTIWNHKYCREMNASTLSGVT